MHEDLGASIAAESEAKTHWKRQSNDSNAWYDSYHSYEEHIEYFKELHASFPNQSEWVSSGTSYEGRDIYGLHLWGVHGPGKPAVLYHGTVHAREWISAPVVEYLTSQLIDGYKTGDNDTQAFLNNYDFFVFPFVNPDGASLPLPTSSLASTDSPQASFTPKPTNASGARTASPARKTAPVSAATSTATGNSDGTPTTAAPPQTLARKPTKAKHPPTPPKTKASTNSSASSVTAPASNYSSTGTATANTSFRPTASTKHCTRPNSGNGPTPRA